MLPEACNAIDWRGVRLGIVIPIVEYKFWKKSLCMKKLWTSVGIGSGFKISWKLKEPAIVLPKELEIIPMQLGVPNWHPLLLSPIAMYDISKQGQHDIQRPILEEKNYIFVKYW